MYHFALQYKLQSFFHFLPKQKYLNLKFEITMMSPSFNVFYSLSILFICLNFDNSY